MSTKITLATLSAAGCMLTAASAHAAIVDFSFTETAPGTWDIAFQLTGSDTSGLASYNIQLVDLEPGLNESVQFDQTRITASSFDGTSVLNQGFDPSTPVQGPVGDTQYSATNSQFRDADPIFGVGKSQVSVTGSLNSVNLGVPTMLGVLTTPAGLTAENFDPGVNLFDSTQTNDGLLASNEVTVNTTVTPIPEPTSLALLGLAGLMVARRRRG